MQRNRSGTVTAMLGFCKRYFTLTAILGNLRTFWLFIQHRIIYLVHRIWVFYVHFLCTHTMFSSLSMQYLALHEDSFLNSPYLWAESIRLKMPYSAIDIPLRKAARALFARLLFVVHGLVSIWRVVVVSKNSGYWLLALMLVLIFVEGALILFTRHGNENRWFCTCIFLYLCAVVPSLWFLQLELSPASYLLRNPNATVVPLSFSDASYNEHAKLDFGGYSVMVPIPLDNEVWLQLLQQTMLVTVILGRWVLPKGDITRDQLSQLLLVFLAMGADIVELFETFKEAIVRNDLNLTIVVLGVWTVSLMQFPLILTGGRTAGGLPEQSTKRGGLSKPNSTIKSLSKQNSTVGNSTIKALSKQNSTVGMTKENVRRLSMDTTIDSTMKLHTSIIFETKKEETFEDRHPLIQVVLLLADDMGFWSMMTSTLLQDAPYLITRLYLLIDHHITSFTMMFFTCKNILVVVLQFYRLMVISCEYRHRVRFAAYFRQYYETGHKDDTDSIAISTTPSSPTVQSTQPIFDLSNPSPVISEKMSLDETDNEPHLNRKRRSWRGGQRANTSPQFVHNPIEDINIFMTSSAPDMSTFKGTCTRHSFSSMSATAIPYYYTSIAALSPDRRLIRKYKSCDDDSGVDVIFQNDLLCHYF